LDVNDDPQADASARLWEKNMSSAWNMPPQVRGVIFVLLGLLFLYFGAWGPIDKARHHEPQLRLAGKAVIAAPLFLGLGAIFLLFGEKSTRMVGINSRPSKLAIPVLLVLIVLGFLLYFWVDHVVASYGYVRDTKGPLGRDSRPDSSLCHDGLANERITRSEEWENDGANSPARRQTAEVDQAIAEFQGRYGGRKEAVTV
jgi:hypothetical protein